MSKLIIKEEKNTPDIIFDPENNQFKISGRSFPENSKKFYHQIVEWFDSFSPDNGSSLDFHFSFYYISSSSIISLMEVIKKINALKEQGIATQIFWYFDDDDDDIKKIGEDYARFFEIPFNLVVNE